MNTAKTNYVKTRVNHVRRYAPTGILFLWFKHKGKRHQPSLNTDDMGLAEIRRDAEIKKIKAAAGLAAPVIDANLTLGELLNRFLAECEAKIGAVTKDCITQSSYDSIECGKLRIETDKPAWLPRTAAKFSLDELKTYTAEVGKKTSPTTYNRLVDVLKRSYALGLEKGWLGVNPAEKLERAPLLPPKSDATLTDAQFDQFIAWLKAAKASNKFHALDLANFLALFAFRIDQARKILKTDVEILDEAQCANNPIKGWIRMRKEHSKRGKKKPDQMFPIIAEALPLVKKLLDRPAAFFLGKPLRNDYLLPIGEAYGIFNRGYRALKFPESIKGHHHFRHLAATKWIENGINIKIVSTLLGHSNIKITLDTYAHVRTAALEEAAGKMTRKTPAPVEPFTPEQIAAAVAYLKSNGNTVPLKFAA